MSEVLMNGEYFRAIQGLVGSKTNAEAKIAETQRDFNDRFAESINYVNNATRNGQTQEFLIVEQSQDKYQLFTRPNEDVKMGDMILWNNIHWLVTDIAFNNTIVNYAIIEPCNRKVIWQNKKGQIIERWCVATKPYSANMRSENIVSTPTGRYNLRVSYDDETQAIDIGKRFMLEVVNGIPKCYKIEFADILSYYYADMGGCIEWTIVSDEYNANRDNISKQICDYTPVVPNTQRIQPMSCFIDGIPELKYGGERRLKSVFYNELCQPIDVESEWEVNLPNTKYYHFEQQDNYLVLSCSPREQLIGDIIHVKLSDKDSKYKSHEIDVKIVPVYVR